MEKPSLQGDDITRSLLPNIAELILDTIFIVDAEGRIRYVSPSCRQLLGYTQEELVGTLLIELVAPEDRAMTTDEAASVLSHESRTGFENRYLHKSGAVVDLMWSARWDAEHQVRIGVARDVTKARRLAAIQASTYKISKAAHSAGSLAELFASVDRIVGSLLSITGFAVAIRDRGSDQLDFQYQRGDVGLTPLEEDERGLRLCSDAVREGRAMLDTVRSGDDQSWIAAPLTMEDESLGVAVVRSRPGVVFGDSDVELLHYVASELASAIERKRLYAELVSAATHDELTGLPNRRHFLDRAEAVLRSARRRNAHFALLYLDLNDFKSVNDAYGHDKGDVLLKEIAARLLKCVREEDTVARLGGDEFIVLLPSVQDNRAAQVLAQRIQDELAKPFTVPEIGAVARGASIGIALYPLDGEDISTMIRSADERMFADKRGEALEIRRRQGDRGGRRKIA